MILVHHPGTLSGEGPMSHDTVNPVPSIIQQPVRIHAAVVMAEATSISRGTPLGYSVTERCSEDHVARVSHRMSALKRASCHDTDPARIVRTGQVNKIDI